MVRVAALADWYGISRLLERRAT
ncbi:uncharacterized protein METZ01_LOCUS31673 [marine metagenome]|uniref:Uncharacterized protein n=1 Tax=marine metagenome TaxID=408172 RepID=A0A381QK57_9ZZZZ